MIKDYEQLYYDLKYENEKLNKQLYLLQQELDTYKKYGCKKINSYLITEIVKYQRDKLNVPSNKVVADETKL